MAMSVSVIEQFVMSKNGDVSSSEDTIVITDHFIAVLDGVTTSGKQIDPIKSRITAGHFAIDVLRAGIERLTPTIRANSAIAFLSELLKSEVIDNVSFSASRPAASLIIYSSYHREIWQVGDCHYLIDGIGHQNRAVLEESAATMRAAFNQARLLSGCSEAQLLSHDYGRDIILPVLAIQATFRNIDTGSDLEFGVIDGQKVPPRFLTIVPVAENERTIVLASDGYPRLFPTLEQSEQYLAQLLHRDPLLIREYRATKGLQEGQVSFDDRAYIRCEI